MNREFLLAERGTYLRKNGETELKISIIDDYLDKIFLINGSSFLTENVTISDLIIQQNEYYMIINNSNIQIEISYNQDISNHEIIYDPYKFETSEKKDLKEEFFKDNFDVSEGYVDTLPKWYSFKFTYPDYNIIFIKPGLGISIQFHKYRAEQWEIIGGKPIILNGNHVYYFVEKGNKFQNLINTYHSVINPNKEEFVLLKEFWIGKFNENDITRIFNPNHYK